MAHINTSTIHKLAKLANLPLSEEEAAKYPDQLSESLDYVENLRDINTDSVPDSFFTTDAHNVMGDDIVDESIMLSHEDAVKNAASVKKGFYVVKRIL